MSGAKSCYLGAPAIFALGIECNALVQAFCRDGAGGCYLVGSVLERPDWRDVDIRLILPDDEFIALFPMRRALLANASWELDARWLLMTTAIAELLAKRTGLPIDFQFQPASFANARHDGSRHSLGRYLVSEADRELEGSGSPASGGAPPMGRRQ